MSFRAYLESHYADVCDLQNSFEHDKKMVPMLRDWPHDADLVKSWMTAYGLFQGRTNREREAIVDRFLKFAREHKATTRNPNEKEIATPLRCLVQSAVQGDCAKLDVRHIETPLVSVPRYNRDQ